MSDLAKGGPVHSQAEGVVRLLHSDLTAIHLVTLLEALPIQETIEAIDELDGLGLPIGSVIVNRNIPAYLPPEDLAKAAEGDIDADAVRAGSGKAGITLSDTDFAGLLTETIQHATRDRGTRRERRTTRRDRRAAAGTARRCTDGVDLGSLYELAEALAQQGCAMSVRKPMSTTPPRPRHGARSCTTPRTGSWCAAAQAASARPPPPRRWRCGPPSTGAPSWC